MFSMFSRHKNKRNEGFSFLELVGAITLLMAGLAAFAGVYLSTTRTTEMNRENNLVTVTIRNVAETLEAAAFTSIVTDYGAGSTREFFWCEADGALLFADPGGAEIAGRLYFYNDEQNIPAEFADLAADGDINGSGTIENTVTDYVILPTRIELTVLNASPPRVVTVDLILTDF